MFEDINISIDQFYYDEDLDLSVIQGWAIDNKTKNQVDISVNVPATVHSNKHVHIPFIFNVSRDVDYGFFIAMPGDVTKIRPTLTFKAGDTVRKVDGIWFDENRHLNRIRKYYTDRLNDRRFHRILNLLRSEKEEFGTEHEVRQEPEDRMTGWIINEEPKEWNETPEESLMPKISFILKYTPKENPDFNFEITNSSIYDQVYKPYEVIVAADREVPEHLIGEGIKVIKEDTISEALNKAVEESTGDYVTFVEDSDILSNHFLSEVGNFIIKHSEADFIYSDSDKIDNNLNRYDLFFKPDFDSMMLRSMNYILNPIILKKELFEKTDGFTEESIKLKNYPFIIEATKKAESIGHIPKILYHWNEKKRDLNEATLEMEEGAEILGRNLPLVNDYTISEFDYVYDVKSRDEYPKASIILLHRDDEGQLRKTVEDIVSTTIYPDYEIITNSPINFKSDKVRNHPFVIGETDAEIKNKLTEKADGEILCFVESGFNPLETSWLRELADYALMDDVALTGPKYYNKFYEFDEAGLSTNGQELFQLGRGEYVRAGSQDYMTRVPREVFGLSVPCIVTTKDKFEKLGMFEEDLSDNEMSVGFSIKGRKAGLKPVLQAQVPAAYNGEFESKLQILPEIYSEDDLTDPFTNVNLKPGSSAYEYRQK